LIVWVHHFVVHAVFALVWMCTIVRELHHFSH
jgi:hypothetical protein